MLATFPPNENQHFSLDKTWVWTTNLQHFFFQSSGSIILISSNCKGHPAEVIWTPFYHWNQLPSHFLWTQPKKKNNPKMNPKKPWIFGSVFFCFLRKKGADVSGSRCSSVVVFPVSNPHTRVGLVVWQVSTCFGERIAKQGHGKRQRATNPTKVGGGLWMS